MARSTSGKIRIEMSRQTAALAAFAGVVALIWMFVFGVFIGRRYTPDTYPAQPPAATAAPAKAATDAAASEPAASPAKDQPAERFAADLARSKRAAMTKDRKEAPAPHRPAAKQAPKKPSSGLRFAVQVGAFSEQQRAQALMADLSRAGYPVYLFTGKSDPRYRVRMGPYGERSEAERAAESVGQKLGIKPYLLNVERS